MADLLTSSYHAIGGYGAMYGCISWKYEEFDTYYRVYIYWLGEGLKTTASDAASPYSISTPATIKGEVLVNGTSKKSWTVTASDTRSGYATYSSYKWFKAGGSNSNYYDVSRTSSAQTVTFKVTYTVSGFSSLTGTATLDVPAATSVTINYNSNGGSGSMSPTVYTKASSGSINLSDNKFTRTGYGFNSWNLAQNGSSTSYSNKQAWSLKNDNSNHSFTLYAQWTNLGPFTITYNANGGTSGEITSQIKTYGTPITIEAGTEPSREGYTFRGWATSDKATRPTYQIGGTYSTEVSATLYAVWAQDLITITYNKNTDAEVTNLPTNQAMGYWSDDSIIISSEIPQRADYTFLGWSLLQSGGEIINPGDTFNNPRPQTLVTLYAQWETSTISYYYWNNIATPHVQKVKPGSSGNLWGCSNQSTAVPDIIINNVTYEFAKMWLKIASSAVSSLTNNSFYRTDNYRETNIWGKNTYTYIRGNHHYIALYKRKSPLPETTQPYMFFIRTNGVLPSEFIEKSEGQFAQLEDVNGRYISGYIRFDSPYPKGTVLSCYPTQSQSSTERLASGLLVRSKNDYSETSTINISISPGDSEGTPLVGVTAPPIIKGNYAYLFVNIGVAEGQELDVGTQIITVSWDTDTTIVTNDYGVEISVAEYVYTLIGINYIIDINATGTMLSLGGEAKDLNSQGKLPIVNYTDNSNNTQGAIIGNDKTMAPLTVTVIQNPLYVSNDIDAFVPAITDGIIEDEIVMKPEIAQQWATILAINGYVE